MVAEDDRSTTRLISFVLERAGYRVATCEHGEELLKLATQIKPALVILDLMMPVKDGYTTLRTLNADPALGKVPVLILSSRSDEDIAARCLGAGAADYMVKPFSPDELVHRVQKLAPRETKT